MLTVDHAKHLQHYHYQLVLTLKCSSTLLLTIMHSSYLPGDEFADMVVEPEDALPLPRESGLLGDGGEGTDIERDVVRFLAAFKGVL